MLAIGRALINRPKLMILDEPSLGLAPIIIREIFESIKRINAEGTTILFVEQDARIALATAQRGYVLRTGNDRADRHLLKISFPTKRYRGSTSAQTDRQTPEGREELFYGG